MKAFVCGGPGVKSLQERPRPELRDAGDAIVRMEKTTLCGVDLHILKGDLATGEPGVPLRRRTSEACDSALERYLAELETLSARSGLALEAARLMPRHAGSDLVWSTVMQEMHAVREVFARSFEHFQSQATDGPVTLLRQPPA